MSSTMMGAAAGHSVKLPVRARTAAFRGTAPRVCVHNRISIDNGFLGHALRPCTSVSQMFVSMPQKSTGHRLVTAMAGKVTGKIKLSLTAGKANPAPPVGPALGSKGVNIMNFCKEYNAATAKMAGQVVPVEITVYEDRSFTFILKTPPASVLLKLAAGVEKGSGKPNKEKVGKVTRAQVLEIANRKMADTNTNRIDSVVKMIEGTAKTIGLTVVD